MTRVLPLLLLACNTAPSDYRIGVAPGARAPWAGPTDLACLDRGETDTEIDGYLFCAEVDGLEKIPVDDPVLVRCAEVAGANTRVVSVYDGILARAYPTDLLLGRELVNDDWGDDPLLIDF